jgi:signal transduction histidine kinase
LPERHPFGGEAITEIEREITNLRGIIDDLRPTVLEDLGLAAALQALAERPGEKGLNVVCELSPPELALGTELDTTVYRLVQEALTNVTKHAQASTARVIIKLTESLLTVRVHDDGVGFDTTNRTSGFGMTGMRERVALAGGTLTMDSCPGEGTTVLATFPLVGAGRVARTG